MFVMSRPQDRDEGGDTAAVRDAQRRARRRALSRRKLDTAAGDQKLNASEVGLTRVHVYTRASDVPLTRRNRESWYRTR